MSIERTAALLVALLCLVGLGVAAATIGQPQVTDPGSGEGEATGEGQAVGGQSRESGSGSYLGLRLPLLTAFGVLFVLLALASVWGATRTDPKFVVSLLLAALVVFGVFGAWILTGDGAAVPSLNNTGQQITNDSGYQTPRSTATPGGEGETEERPLDLPLLPLVSVGLVLVMAAVVFYGATGDEDVRTAGAGTEAAPDGTDRAAVREAAGRAADELAAAGDVSNGVYRAWREMTAALDVPDPETSTPREFERAAVEAGMDPGDVAEITGLFEAVRYGDAPPSGDRERRAVAALRRIEGGGADGADAAGDDAGATGDEDAGGDGPDGGDDR